MATVRAAVEAILAGGRDGPVESEASDLAERFVLNREAMLASLVAGSNDFHYYHALDLLAVAQETGTLDDAFDAHLAGLKDPVTGNQSMAREIEARSQLIKYDIATAAGDEEAQRLVLDFLKTSLYVSLSHGIEGTRELATASGDGGDGDDAAPAETDPVAAAMAEPITVDDPLPEHAVTAADAGDHPHLFATHDLLEAEFERVTSTPGAHNYESITGFSDLAMEWLAEHDGLTDKMAISLLQRIASASAAPVAMANLVPLVVRHLNYRTASMIETDQHTSFGTAPIDYQLTLAQLDEVAEAVPRVRTTSAFVDTYISKLHPAEGVNVYSNTTARWELLERLFAFVDTLPASYNGHRGTLLVHMLEFKIQQNGEYDVEMFQRWLDIPRNARYVAETAYGGARDTNGNTRYHTYNRVTVSIFNPRDENQDQALITAFLKHLFVDAADMAPWDNYISDNVLKPLFASVKLTAHGATGAEADGWRKMINSDYQVEQLRTSVKLEFPANANKTHVSTADEVSLVLTTKNVPELVVKVFEINTEAIARTGGSVNDHMDLEGMEPNHQFRYTYDEAPIIEARREFTFPDLPSRGVFIFLFVGANRICRAVVRKGNLSYVQRMSVAGHILRVIDDTNAPVDDAAVVCNGTVYNADDRGEVCVPFTSGTSHVTANLTIRSGNFHVTSNLRIAPEDYALDAAIYVDREQLITGHRATVALRAALYLASAGNIRVPVSMVENVEMVVKTTDIEGTAASTSIKHFDLSDEQEYTYTFSCPDNVQTVDVTLTGTVPIAARTEAVSNLSASASFSLNAINKTDAMDDIYLRRTEGGYELMVLDKSGRPQAGRTFSVSAKNRYMSSSSTSVGVTADANGVAKLGHLEDVYEISALTKTFKLSADHVVYRPSVVVTADDEIAFPCLDEAVMASGLHVALVDSNGCGVVTTDHRDAVTIEGGYFRIGPLPVGSYTFSFAHNRSFAVIAIRVVDGADLTLSPDATGAVATFKLSQEPLDGAATAQQVVTGAPEPLHIVEASADGTAGTVSIQLGGFSPSTRVHVLFTHFDPIYDASRLSLGRRDPPLQTASVVRPASSFMSATTMSSEQVYILKRRYAAKQAGNMLDRPSLLLNLNDNPGDVSQIPDFSDPEATAASSLSSASKKKMSKRGRRRMEKECAEECDDDFDGFYGGGGGGGAPFAASAPAPRRMGKKEMAGGFIEMSDAERNSILANNFRYNMGFLTKSALACYNIVPSDQGVIELELAADDLVDRYCVTVVAVDGFETSIKRLPLANARQSNRIYRDTRLLAALDAESHYSEEKRIDAAAAGATFAFPDVTASEYALYDDLARVYHLYHMLCQSAHVKTFAFVLKWGTLTEAEKRAKFSEYVSHELNFFIYKKDPEFFAAVVAPYLAHKKAKTFMDFWLLGDEEGVASYAEPRRFERLNIVEKILLGQRVDGDASLRLVNDLADLLPRDQEGFNALFKIALKAKLDASDQSALDAASNRAASALNPNLMGDGGGGADASGSSDFDRRAAYRQTYQDVAKTVEYGEMNYYKLKVEQCNDPGLVGINQFWRDYANHSLGGGDGAFVSSNFVRAHRTFTEVMFALAVLDLPAALDGDHTFHNADHPRLEITFACPTIVVHKQLSGAEWDAKPIIVTQNYFDPDDHFEYVDNERQDKYLDVGSTLLKTNKVYECEAVVSNITNTPQNLDLLLQIPRGAVPLRGGFYLKGWYARLDAYETATIKYFFYFPCPGRYVHFPVNALKNSVAIAAAEINTLTIVSELPRAYLRNSEEKSWVQVATNDDLETVLAYMESHNIQRLRMRSLAHRCRDKAWFDALVPYIRSRGHYSHALWSYGILHNDAQTIAEYLAHREGFLRSVGDVLATSLATIRPEADFRLQHLEYHPIVYSRAHYFDTSISSQAPQGLRTAYARLLKALTYVRQGTFDERLGLMYYLLSQERVGEAKAVLAGIAADPSINLDDGAPSCAMQFDYLLAYLDFYNTGTLEVAEAIAAKYADHPVARWRKLFREVANQIREARGEAVEDAEGDELSRNQAMSRLAAADPSLSLSVEDDSIVVNYENMEALDVNFFFTDVEVLFSRSPFRESVSSMEVKPNFTTAVELDPEASVFTMAVPDEVRGRNCIIEVSGAGRSDSVSYYSSSLNVQISEAYGQLKVTHADTGAPLRCVYVKVYAQEHGSSVFWKDCYTDLRGKADYATISEKNVSGVSKFSILVLSDEHGASIRACGPPRS